MSSLVSVIVPFHNRLPLLENAITSVFSQSYRPIELILVNDGGEKCNRNRQQVDGILVKYIDLAKNNGPSVARNAGLDEASGEYIAFLDSDDQWLKNKLDQQINKMISLGCVFTHTNYIKHNMEDGKQSIVSVGQKNYGILRTAFWCRIATPTVVFKREAFETIRFDPTIKVGEDILFWLQCCERGNKLIGLDQQNCIVNISSTSHSSNKENTIISHEVINNYLSQKKPALGYVHRLFTSVRKMIVRIYDISKSI